MRYDEVSLKFDMYLLIILQSIFCIFLLGITLYYENHYKKLYLFIGNNIIYKKFIVINDIIITYKLCIRNASL